jgi:hypothetical protein
MHPDEDYAYDRQRQQRIDEEDEVVQRPRYTPTYQSWQAMKQRCNQPAHKHYSNYGGRGIKVCARWNQYANFLEDMGERPANHSLDRLDNSVGYSPVNCRWATRTEQNRNNSQNRNITFDGQTKCLSEWCEILNLNYARVYARLFKLKWKVEDAFC